MKILLFLFLLSAPVFPALGADGATYARFVPEREDDFAWENDLVAFRAYGPAMRRRPARTTRRRQRARARASATR